MNTLWKYLQYGYLLVAIIFLIDGFESIGVNNSRAYLSFGFAIFIVLIFFFKRRFRKKVQERNQQNKPK